MVFGRGLVWADGMSSRITVVSLLIITNIAYFYQAMITEGTSQRSSSNFLNTYAKNFTRQRRINSPAFGANQLVYYG